MNDGGIKSHRELNNSNTILAPGVNSSVTYKYCCELGMSCGVVPSLLSAEQSSKTGENIYANKKSDKSHHKR